MTTKSLSSSKRPSSKSKDLKPSKKTKGVSKKAKKIEETNLENSDDEPENFEQNQPCSEQELSACEELEDNEDAAESKQAESAENPKTAWMTPEQKEEKKKAQKEEQKRLRQERKLSKPGYELINAVRPDWDIARRMDTPKEQRTEAINRLFERLTGGFRDLILKHEGSRVVQTCVKHGNPEQRKQVAEELKGSFLEISKNKYGKHIVNKLMLYCPDKRDSIMGEFSGHIVKGMRHKEAAFVIESIFANYANVQRKQQIVQEFYGPEYALFKKEPTHVSKIIAESPEKRPGIAKSLEEALSILLIKGNLGLTLVHRLIVDYLDAAEPVKAQEWISGISEFLPEILHTSDGAIAVSKCIAMASSKDRKAIVKSFKPFIEKICKDDRGFQTILAIFSLIDDTVLVGKVILSEIKGMIESLIKNVYGRKVLGYLIFGVNRRIIPHFTIQLIEQTRTISTALGTSKKDPETRHSELKAQIGEVIITGITGQLNSLVKDMETAVFLAEIVGALPVDQQPEMVQKIIEAFGEDAFQPGPKCECIKKIIKNSNPSASEPIFNAIAADLPSLVVGEAAYMLMHMLRFTDHPISGMVKKLQSKLKKVEKTESCQTLLKRISEQSN